MSSTNEANPGDRQPEPKPRDSTADWDVVDEASWESFPASDPPAYSGPKSGQRWEAQTSDLEANERQALREALGQAYRAWAIHGRAEHPLSEVRDSQARQIETLRALFEAHGLTPFANPRAEEPSAAEGGPAAEGLAAAGAAEEAAAAAYERLCEDSEHAELREAGEALRRRSKDEHLPALRRAARSEAG